MFLSPDMQYGISQKTILYLNRSEAQEIFQVHVKLHSCFSAKILPTCSYYHIFGLKSGPIITWALYYFLSLRDAFTSTSHICNSDVDTATPWNSVQIQPRTVRKYNASTNTSDVRYQYDKYGIPKF